jgi:hypothetical protein
MRAYLDIDGISGTAEYYHLQVNHGSGQPKQVYSKHDSK